jgi:hypothetical protein
MIQARFIPRRLFRAGRRQPGIGLALFLL